MQPMKAQLAIEQAAKDLPRPLPSGPLSLKRGKEEGSVDMPQASHDRTTLPNWMLSIICTLFMVLLGFVYQTVSNRIDDVKTSYRESLDTIKALNAAEVKDLKDRVSRQETYMRNSRELLIEHGWNIDDDGKITKRR